MENALPYKKGISIDTNPVQMAVIAVMFVIFFVLPIAVHRYYLLEKDDNTVDETYTEQSLNQGQVAGASDERASTPDGYMRLPIFNVQVEKDLSNPGSLAIMVGGIFGLLSLVLFATIFFDFLKA